MLTTDLYSAIKSEDSEALQFWPKWSSIIYAKNVVSCPHRSKKEFVIVSTTTSIIPPLRHGHQIFKNKHRDTHCSCESYKLQLQMPLCVMYCTSLPS